MEPDAVLLARIQFAFTIGYHILFPTLSTGLAMLLVVLEARELATGDPRWARYGRAAFDWFLGQNHLGTPLYDAATGGCRDGLHSDGPNENQGAESTLSFLMALLEVRGADATGGPGALT